jgi:hypothetical protein
MAPIRSDSNTRCVTPGSRATGSRGDTREVIEVRHGGELAVFIPCVYPFINTAWLAKGGTHDEIPFRNSGPGVALNVTGQIYAAASGPNTPLLGTTLA